MDILTAPAAAHAETRRGDYRPPDWLVPEVALDFTLDPDRSTVRSQWVITGLAAGRSSADGLFG